MDGDRMGIKDKVTKRGEGGGIFIAGDVLFLVYLVRTGWQKLSAKPKKRSN